MENKTVIITGATSGIGRAAAFEMCKNGHKLVMLGRNQEKIDETVAAIIEKYADAKIDTYQIDLSNLDAVKSLTEVLKQQYPIIDVLVNNAGSFQMKEEILACGFEKTIVVNYFSHFILTMGLLDNLKAAEQGRIINVSSDSYKLTTNTIDKRANQNHYNWSRAYNRSKLAQIQFTHTLKDKLTDSNVVVTAVSPGGVRTKIYDPMPTIIRWLVSLSLKPVHKGIRGLLTVALSEDAKEYHGKFVRGRKVKKVHKKYLDKKQSEFLWQQSNLVMSNQ